MQVLRYVLEPSDDFEGDPAEGYVSKVTLPEGAQLLPGAAFTTKGLVVYALADRDAPDGEERAFFVAQNGVDLPEQLAEPQGAAIAFRGTAKPVPGSPTAHVFELAKVPA